MTLLPDVNVLVALAWPNHVHHQQARAWFADARGGEGATCPITEAGFVRVSSNRRVIPDARSVAETAAVLRALRSPGGHRFWIDGISPADCAEVPFDALDGYRQITEALLLAQAARHGGALVTFDRAAASLGRANGIEVHLLGL